MLLEGDSCVITRFIVRPPSRRWSPSRLTSAFSLHLPPLRTRVLPGWKKYGAVCDWVLTSAHALLWRDGVVWLLVLLPELCPSWLAGTG